MSDQAKRSETASDQHPFRPVRDEATPIPDWWNRHGTKVMVERLDIANRRLKLSTNAVSLLITSVAQSVDEGWFVEWGIRYAQQQKVEGRIVLSTDDLRVAFWLRPAPEADNRSRLARRFQADAIKQGRFVRTDAYLNIPGPGTGYSGDPNLSIFLDESIREAVEALLQSKRS